MQALEIDHIFSKISTVRLDTYKNQFNLDNPSDTYAAYCWGEAVSGSIFKIISVIEILLRNSIHNSLKPALGKKWMIDEQKIKLTDHQKDKIDNILYEKKDGRRTDTRVEPTPNENTIISKLSFGFWSHFLDIKLLDGKSWDMYLPDIFSNYSYVGRYKGRQFWKDRDKKNIYALKDRLRDINEIRNRIAHHEPVWKKSYEGYQSKNISDNLNNTVLLILDVLNWLSGSFYQSYIESYHYEYLKYLVSKTPQVDFNYHNDFIESEIDIFIASVQKDKSILNKNHVLTAENSRIGYFVKL
ncbi:Abi family protein [Acinetobacter pittii]|uniref:Abi family protein n=1 Tax=Acinetobacter pittii TaxID=48296 RepID=UPI00192A8265|nr:Abi family protein [Acinetobacter pittii]